MFRYVALKYSSACCGMISEAFIVLPQRVIKIAEILKNWIMRHYMRGNKLLYQNVIYYKTNINAFLHMLIPSFSFSWISYMFCLSWKVTLPLNIPFAVSINNSHIGQLYYQFSNHSACWNLVSQLPSLLYIFLTKPEKTGSGRV